MARNWRAPRPYAPLTAGKPPAKGTPEDAFAPAGDGKSESAQPASPGVAAAGPAGPADAATASKSDAEAPGPTGGAKRLQSSDRRVRLSPSLRVATAKRWRSRSAQMPVPRMRDPKLGSLRRPL